MPDEMRKFLVELYEAWNSCDVERLIEFYDPEYEGSDLGSPAPQRGLAGVREWVAPYWIAMPDLAFTLLDSVVEGDRVTMLWNARGTHLGPMMNVPATGRTIEFRGMSMLTIRNRKLLRGTYMWDVLAVLGTLGVLPS